MREVGQVALAQVQSRSLKQGSGADECYDPAPLVVVEQVVISPRGVIGLRENGDWILDAHHTDHPRSRHRGDNSVSVGFTSHYAAMRERFGPHMADGSAAENIVVTASRIMTLRDLHGYVVVLHQPSGQFFMLAQVRVATPCLPFARFALGPASEQLRDQRRAALQFLNHGMRGFYLAPSTQHASIVVATGDRVFVSETLPEPVPCVPADGTPAQAELCVW